MNEKKNILGLVRMLYGSFPARGSRIDTSDIPDSRPEAKLGTLRDAVERARARRMMKEALNAPTRPGR